ncbi:FtsX-like permease family protein [Agrococcus carbonis]|uniref:FtsX-like permease family protein n=1 Tax=Agrococcus carbonis TaxID=684552 RepID=A0A1H1PMR1_9MICO|nr:FtsX-like permease family protein [Agrococcus carbonis]SDS12582.1 FtsX-like permease family protein [Agrococcus carbonis]
MSAVLLWARLLRATGPRATDVLSATAFAFATAALLAVLGGVNAFRLRLVEGRVEESLGSFVLMLAFVAAALLLPAVWTLAQAAVRLAIARRDDRLAALRLAGATRGQVTAMAVLDAVAQALVGVLVGAALALAVTPGIARIEFQGLPFTVAELLPPAWVWGAAAGAVVLIALVAALASLQRVHVTPLGVAQRVSPKRLSLWRIAGFVAVVAAYVVVVVLDLVPVELTFSIALISIVLLSYSLIGPLVIQGVAWLVAKGARSPAALLAARRVVDDPRGAFNIVGAMAIAVMAGGFASLAPAMAGAGDPMSDDMATGAVLTIAIAGVLGAVLAGIAQSAKVLDQRREHQAMHRMGVDLPVMQGAIVRQVLLPLLIGVGGAAGMALLLILPTFMLWVQSPASIVTWMLMAVGAVVVTLGATACALPLVRRVATEAAPA